MAIAPLLCAPPCGVTLDDVQLALRGVLALTISQLAAERGRVHHALAHHFTRLTRRLPCFGGNYGLVDDLLGGLRMFLKVASDVFTHRILDNAFDLTGDQLTLGL